MSRSDAGSTFSGGVAADSAIPTGQKIRGIQKKISRLRSRSVERISQRSQRVRERLQQIQLQRQDSVSGSGGVGGSAVHVQPVANSTAQLMIPTAPRSGGHILPTPLPNRHASVGGGGEEEQDDGSCSQSSIGESAQGISYQGRARALVDYTPSPYDRDALKFKVP